MLSSRNILFFPFYARCFTTTPIRCWQNFENERHYEPGEEFLKRVKHGLTYDFRRAQRRYKEVFNKLLKFKIF